MQILLKYIIHLEFEVTAVKWNALLLFFFLSYTLS